MYNKKKEQQKEKQPLTKDSRKVIKPPAQNNNRLPNQRRGTADSQKHKQDEQIQKIILIIRQFLLKMGYSRTASTLNSQKLTKRPVKQQLNTQQNTDLLFVLFEKGNRDDFFKAWNKWFPNIPELSYKKLEFELYIYFYIYPIHPQFRKNNNSVVDPVSVQQFKKYLETKGSDLSRTTQFLSFYALPYIQKPQQHPAISHVFTKEWLIKLRKGLQQFIKNNAKLVARNQKSTSLQKLYRNSQDLQNQKVECNHEAQLQQLRQQNQTLVAYVHTMQQNFNVVSEVSKTNMMQSQVKWFQFSKQILYLVKKVQKGEKVDGKIKELENFFNKDIEELFITKDISIFQRNSVTTQDHLSISPLSHSVQKKSNNKSDNVLPIDSAKILTYLAGCDKPQNQIGAFLVLQALRWRFTKLKSVASKRQILVNYTMNDLCVVTKPNWKIQETILFKSPTRVKVCYLRLLNYITSDYVGINYLNKQTKLISNLIKVFKGEVEDNSTKKHSLGVLQKLSLLKQPQQIMLNEGILEQIIRLLKQNNLQDYSVQYLTALLMNLSLRKLGKFKLQQHKNELVQLIYKYLLTDNIQVKNYINGTLYSFLEISQPFKQASLQIGMVERIIQLMADCEEKLFTHQYELIIEKLNSKEVAGQNTMSDEQDEELDYDDVDDEEQNDLIDDDKSSQCYEWEDEYLSGQQLLMKQFPLLGPDGIRDQLLTRSMIQQNTKKSHNVSSISKSKRGNQVFGGRPVTPSLNGIDNDLEKSLIKYSRM